MNFNAIKKKVGLEGLSIAFTLLLLYLFMAVLMNLEPRWILSSTVTTGGDMGSHYILAQYLKDYLLPHGKLIGWYPGWQAGLPMFQYYFSPPYLLMVVLSYIIPLEVAFKLVTIMWFFMLPPAVYLGLRAMGFSSPAPAVASCLSMCLLFLETVDGANYSQWGGNIKSTLAGQFPYGISFALMMLSIGLLYKGYHDRKHLVLSSAIFALVALNHIYTTIIIALVSTFFIVDALRSRKFDGLVYLAKVFALGFLIAGFWYLPMAFKLSWSIPPKDVFYGTPNFSWIFIKEYAVFYILALAGIVLGVRSRDKRIVFLVYSFTIVLLFLFLCRYTNFLYVRFLPFLYIIPLLLAAEGISRLTSFIEAKSLIPLIVALLVVFLLYSSWVKDIPAWIKWNYEGLEGKSTYGTLKDTFNYMRNVNITGRVDVEYGDYNYFGTPRVFEVMPMFTNKSVMEGLLFESSLTFPFFFYMQKTVSETSWWPGFKIAYPRKNDMDKGLKIFRLYNIQYFIASSRTIKDLLEGNPDYHLEHTIRNPQQNIELNFYRINEDSGYVEYPAREPVLVVTDDWKPFSFRWIDTNYLDVPVVYSGSLGGYELEHFRLIVINKTVDYSKIGSISLYLSNQFEEALNASKQVDNAGCAASSAIYEEELFSNITCTGRPLLVKIPYYPNWQTEDARKIYLASPALMLVFPEKNNLRLYYGMLFSDYLGWIATAVGVLIVFGSVASKFKPKEKSGKSSKKPV